MDSTPNLSVENNKRKEQFYAKVIESIKSKGFPFTFDEKEEKLNFDMTGVGKAELYLSRSWQRIENGENEEAVLRITLERIDETALSKFVKIRDNIDRVVPRPRAMYDSVKIYYEKFGKNSRTYEGAPIVYDITDHLHLSFALDMPNSFQIITVGRCKKEGMPIPELMLAARKNSVAEIEKIITDKQLHVTKTPEGVYSVTTKDPNKTGLLLMHMVSLFPIFQKIMNSKSEMLLVYLPSLEVILLSELTTTSIHKYAQDIYSTATKPLAEWPYCLTSKGFEELTHPSKLPPEQIKVFLRASGLSKIALEKKDEGSLREAIKASDEFFEICKEGPEKEYLIQRAYLARGKLEFNVNRLEKAIEYFLKIEKYYMHTGEVYYLLGMAYDRLGKLEEAREFYKKTSIYRPSKIDIYYNMASIDIGQGRFKEAIENLDMVLLLHPKLILGHYQRGIAYMAMNEKEKAKEDFKKTLELDPQNQNAINKLKELE